MIEYFIFGLGFYIGMSSCFPKSFVQADLASLLRGMLLGIVFWPVGMCINVYLAMKEIER